MDDMISRQAAIDIVRHECGEWKGLAKEIVKQFNGLPAADVAPVRHGKWIFRSDVYGLAYCSECDYEIHGNDTYYCPYCGAKMDGGEQDG